MRCSKCKEEKEQAAFSRTNKAEHLRSGWQAYCKPCALQAGNLWRNNNKEHCNSKARARSVNVESRLKSLLSASTVNRKELDYNWCLSRLEKINYKCEVTGIPFTYDSRSPTGLSIDRIDPTKGYTPDNIRFVCWWVNAAMGHWGLDKLKELIMEWYTNAD